MVDGCPVNCNLQIIVANYELLGAINPVFPPTVAGEGRYTIDYTVTHDV